MKIRNMNCYSLFSNTEHVVGNYLTGTAQYFVDSVTIMKHCYVSLHEVHETTLNFAY